VLAVPGLEDLHAGIVVQAYLRDSADDLESLAAWARGRRVAPSVRLVKGAYWDTETVHAAARDWPSPVFDRKEQTDANYEHLAQRLLEHRGTLRAAFATHNLRSLAAAVVDARALGVAENGFELQLLYGMAEPVHEALRRSGMRLRVYAPVGELVPGMAYLVRRLLENTSNQSFVRHHFAEGEALEELLDAPDVRELPRLSPPTRRPPSDVLSVSEYRPEPPAEWERVEVRGTFAKAVEDEFARSTREVHAVIGGEKVRPLDTFVSVNPAAPDDVVAEVAACGPSEAEAAVKACGSALGGWSRTDPTERAAVIFRAAEQMRSRRFELAALEVRETGKGWADADADVCEAIDYCEYYARRMLALAKGGEVQSPPGEDNRLSYRARGVCAVVSPWNFPLAIPTGMTVAALVTGNTVVLKPAEQAPAVAAELAEILNSAGLPQGALCFLPGDGERAGAPLVSHVAVDTIAFTGSRAVGLSILETSARQVAGRMSIPRVIAELGGKNAIVVDSDADLDEVVPAVIGSAFGFAGQKCSAASRLIVVDPVHDAAVKRVVEAARSLVIGPARRSANQLGPVIDNEAFTRLNAAISNVGDVGRVALARDDVPERGWFVGPTVVTDVDPGSWLANEELFGPVLATFRVPDFESALELANRTEYALTAGVFSRSADHIALASRVLRAGNVYVNRAITGAVVGRQPFGGSGMSGIGWKAGGPDYLLQFLDPHVVSENTVRQGFAPEVLDAEVVGGDVDDSSSPADDEVLGGRGVA
jgi:RHH-type proline utilization regulon transcriptional repressor/proline dehydrogenase/delta 1-pyrroline-5-carboxylate dehydrogenase